MGGHTPTTRASTATLLPSTVRAIPVVRVFPVCTSGTLVQLAGDVGARRENGGVTLAHPTLDLWDEPAPDHRSRVVANSLNRVAWLKARSRGVTATDVARLSSLAAVKSVALEKLSGTGFGGNAFTDHGRAREPEIARWVLANHGIAPSSDLYHAHGQPLHLATPDGVSASGSTVVLCEIKTTSHSWRSIPRSYLRQVWWQQYVLGAERTLVVWEQHTDFVPVSPEPQVRWVERDDNEIYVLVGLANRVLEAMSPDIPRMR
jgi:YqaJ-like viral recombinase domain